MLMCLICIEHFTRSDRFVIFFFCYIGKSIGNYYLVQYLHVFHGFGGPNLVGTRLTKVGSVHVLLVCLNTLLGG